LVPDLEAAESEVGAPTMPIRISCGSTEGVTTVRIEGRLLSEDLPSLQTECARHPASLRLELSDLQFADRESVEELRRLIHEGAELVSASPYLELLLRPRPTKGDGSTATHEDEGAES
jgi:hypothetical protein